MTDRFASRPRALPAAIVLFGIMAAHALLETARDALFLVRLGPDQLAWAYLAIAAVAVVAVGALRHWGRTCDPRRVLVGFLAVAALGTGILGATIALAPSLVFVLYVWTGLVATLVVPMFWSVIDRSLQISDAKRLFAAIGAGGVLGALVGSLLATALAWMFTAPVLVWVAASVLLATAIVTAVLAPHPTIAAPARVRAARVDRAGSTLRSRRYVRVLLVLAVTSTVTLTLGDLMFKRFVAEYFAGRDLATMFGAIYTGLNLLGLAIQLAITPRLLDRLGVGATLTILPAMILASALGFVVTGAAIAIIALKLADGGLRHSVHRVASEILFVPLASAVRDTAKPAIEAIGQRGGQALAAILTFAVASGASGTWMLGAMTVVAGFAWLAAVVVTRSHYVLLFRDTLDAGDIQRDISIPTLDGRSIAMLTAALSSPDESEALAALDLLARRGDRVPALVLYHPSSTVVRRALSLLEGTIRTDVERVLLHLTAHADPQIRAAALAAASRTGCHPDRLAAALTDAEPEVRAAAAVGLGAANRDATGPIEALISGSLADRVALAHAVGRAPAQFTAILDTLVARREPAVMREVLRVWARAPELADADVLVGLLEDPNVRGDVRRVFTAAGPRFFDRLLAALDDARTRIGVRRHLPRTISRFNSPAAATALVSRLIREPDGTTEFKILRALGRMRAEAPTLPLDLGPLHYYVRRTTEDAARYCALGEGLRLEIGGPSLELLRELLGEKRRHAIERVFRALGVMHPRSDLRSLHDAITGDDAERRGAAREILESLIPSALRIPVLSALAPSSEPSPYRNSEELFTELLLDPSDSLRCIAAHHVAERHLVALRSELTRLRPYASSFVGHAFDQAIERLDA